DDRFVGVQPDRHTAVDVGGVDGSFGAGGVEDGGEVFLDRHFRTAVRPPQRNQATLPSSSRMNSPRRPSSGLSRATTLVSESSLPINSSRTGGGRTAARSGLSSNAFGATTEV